MPYWFWILSLITKHGRAGLRSSLVGGNFTNQISPCFGSGSDLLTRFLLVIISRRLIYYPIELIQTVISYFWLVFGRLKLIALFLSLFSDSSLLKISTLNLVLIIIWTDEHTLSILLYLPKFMKDKFMIVQNIL